LVIALAIGLKNGRFEMCKKGTFSHSRRGLSSLRERTVCTETKAVKLDFTARGMRAYAHSPCRGYGWFMLKM